MRMGGPASRHYHGSGVRVCLNAVTQFSERIHQRCRRFMRRHQQTGGYCDRCVRDARENRERQKRW